MYKVRQYFLVRTFHICEFNRQLVSLISGISEMTILGGTPHKEHYLTMNETPIFQIIWKQSLENIFNFIYLNCSLC